MTRALGASFAACVATAVPAATIHRENWKPCALRSMDANYADADFWAVIPAWTRKPEIAKYFDNEPRLLANHGLCNAKFERVVLCLPAWDIDPPTTPAQKVCGAVLGRGKR